MTHSLSVLLRRSALLLAFAGPAAVAQTTTISGQISLQERPGAQTDDLADAVIWLEPAPAPGAKRQTRKPAIPAVSMQLQGRQFSPRVRAVPEGTKLQFANADPFSHNVFSKAPDATFDTGVYGRGQTKDKTFQTAGVFPVYCNIHPRMIGYVVTVDTPHFTQAGEDGRFSIGGVPAGTYTLHLWHDRATAASTRQITVGTAPVALGSLSLDARGYRFQPHLNKFGKEYTSSTGDRY